MSNTNQFSPMVDEYNGIKCEIITDMISKYPFLEDAHWICKKCTIQPGWIKDLKIEATGYTKKLQVDAFSQSFQLVPNYIKEYFVLCDENVLVPRTSLNNPLDHIMLFDQAIPITSVNIMYVFCKTTLTKQVGGLCVNFQKTWFNFRRGKWGRIIKD